MQSHHHLIQVCSEPMLLPEAPENLRSANFRDLFESEAYEEADRISPLLTMLLPLVLLLFSKDGGFNLRNLFKKSSGVEAAENNSFRLELLLPIVLFVIYLFTNDGNLNIRDGLKKINLSNVLENLKSTNGNLKLDSIKKILDNIKSEGGQISVSGGNTNSKGLLDIIKQGIELANELKNDPEIQKLLGNSMDTIDSDTVKSIADKIKKSSGQSGQLSKDVDTNNLTAIINQGITLANQLKNDPSIQELLKRSRDIVNSDGNEAEASEKNTSK